MSADNHTDAKKSIINTFGTFPELQPHILELQPHILRAAATYIGAAATYIGAAATYIGAAATYMFLQKILPLRGSILQVETCQIFSLAENPRWSRVWQ